jgi:hypothetical protein
MKKEKIPNNIENGTPIENSPQSLYDRPAFADCPTNRENLRQRKLPDDWRKKRKKD